jgi:hypothetical protein
LGRGDIALDVRKHQRAFNVYMLKPDGVPHLMRSYCK